MGTVFASLLRDRGHEVTLACRDPEQVGAIGRRRATRATARRRPARIDARTVADAPVADAELVVVAVPSRAFGEVVDGASRARAGAVPDEGARPGDRRAAVDARPDRPVAVLSGPNISEEIARGLPAAAVIASEDEELAERLQQAINSTVFRVYVNPDVIGVELCAAAKNVIALAAGGADGLGLGDNAKAALITRGLAEMARLGDAAGAAPRRSPGSPAWAT